MPKTTYYINPNTGVDNNSGNIENSPWKSFEPINEMKLEPGDCIEILEAGSFSHSLAIRGEGSEDDPIHVNFAPGRYDFFLDKAIKRKYDISNNNDGRELEKKIGIFIDHTKNIFISGPEARIVFRTKVIEICIDHSENIIISDLKFDYHRPTVSEYTVIEADESSAEISVHPDSKYEIQNEIINWLGEEWSYKEGLTQELDTETDILTRRKYPLTGLKIKEIAKNKLIAIGNHDMIKGRVYQVRDTFRDCVGVFINRSKDIQFFGCDFYFMHGMGIVGQFSENISLDTVRIAPEEGSGKTSACWADCTHFSGCKGDIVMKNCFFCGAHDDATNVHGTYLRVVEKLGPKKMKVRFIHKQTYGFYAFNPGDEIEFVHHDTLVPFATNRVIDVEMINPKDLLLTLRDEIPDDYRIDDVVENTTWTANVDISGCTSKHLPSRGFLLTTRGKVRVENNRFISLRRGIHIEGDTQSWFESGSVHDMEIKNNVFENCLTSGVAITPNAANLNNNVHKDIRIVNNTFIIKNESDAVEARCVANLTLQGNIIRNSGSRKDKECIQISNCGTVEID